MLLLTVIVVTGLLFLLVLMGLVVGMTISHKLK
jgi:hypothetical protein